MKKKECKTDSTKMEQDVKEDLLNSSKTAVPVMDKGSSETAAEARKMPSKYHDALQTMKPVRLCARPEDECPVHHVGLLSYISVHWLNKFMWTVYKAGSVDYEELWKCPTQESADENSKRFEKLWREEIKTKGLPDASLGWTLIRFIRTRIMVGLLVNVVTISLGFIAPTLFYKSLLDYITEPGENLLYGLLLAGGLFVTEILRVFAFVTVWLTSYQTAFRAKSAIMTLLYDKLLRLRSLKNKSVGEIVNLYANDSYRIYDAVCLGPLLLGSPLMAIAATVYCTFILGPWALLGSAVIALFYPYQFFISKVTSQLRKKVIVITDKRVMMMNEILTCIKLIKLYAWEKSFAKCISSVRGDEKRLLQRMAFIQTLGIAFSPMVPIFAAVAAFSAHTLAGNDLSVTQAFVVLTFFGLSMGKMSIVSYGVKAIPEAIVSLQRIKDILSMEDFCQNNMEIKMSDPNLVIEIKAASFAWDSPKSLCDGSKNGDSSRGGENSTKNESYNAKDTLLVNGKHTMDNEADGIKILHGIDFALGKGELCGVCGSVGSGKSSLISAILGQMQTVQGSVTVSAPVAYVPQQAWILNTTLRENILFGLPYEHDRYQKVLIQCCLNEDIEMFFAGDQTEIGERGINLSGGQKQRVSLARALYSNRDIYLLDDPLSAVDPHVGQHIFEHCFKDALQGKSVLLITHQLQYLSQCDSVILLRDGTVLEKGSHSDLMEQDGEYAALIRTFHSQQASEQPADEDDVFLGLAPAAALSQLSLANLKDSQTNLAITKEDISDRPKVDLQAGKLIQAEEVGKEAVSWRSYLDYCKAAGGLVLCLFVLLTFSFPVACSAFANLWLSHWLNQGSGNTTVTVGNMTMHSVHISDNPDLYFYTAVYAGVAVSVVVTTLFRGFLFMTVTLKASSTLHDTVFAKILRSPMSFFDTTPIGRLLNRFTKDLDEVDVRLPFRAEQFLQNVCMVLASLVIIAMVFPWFITAVVPLAILFIFLNKMYRVVLRQVKRADNVSRSPLFSHIATTVQGLQVIHAYNKREEFLTKFKTHFDQNTMPSYLFYCCMRWLALRLDVLTSIITFTTAILIVTTKDQIPPSFAGLALVYAAQITGLFQFTIRLASDTEAHFTSVERIQFYIDNIETEAPAIKKNCRPPKDWPSEGAISYRNYSMRYRPGLPLVLTNINCEIHSKEKIGIVGRTGSGKSSLGITLFRIVEAASGDIVIDGVDISSIGLEDLRSQLAIIPQDPVLFLGTIRYNLDPLHVHDDEALWKALEKCHVKETIFCLEKQLDAPVIENGDNFSAGERQLLCMSRALLRHSKILILDEATAAIDTETDAKIQITIKEAFAECTMLTIAHRLNTVLTSDRILVMEEGKVVEFAEPAQLLEDPHSQFYAMMQASELSAKTVSANV